MINKIKNQLSLLTQGMNTGDKRDYLKELGFTWDEITQLGDTELKDLYRSLIQKPVNEMEVVELRGNMSGYKITRHKNPNKKNKLSDISFGIFGYKQ